MAPLSNTEIKPKTTFYSLPPELRQKVLLQILMPREMWRMNIIAIQTLFTSLRTTFPEIVGGVDYVEKVWVREHDYILRCARHGTCDDRDKFWAEFEVKVPDYEGFDDKEFDNEEFDDEELGLKELFLEEVEPEEVESEVVKS